MMPICALTTQFPRNMLNPLADYKVIQDSDSTGPTARPTRGSQENAGKAHCAAEIVPIGRLAFPDSPDLFALLEELAACHLQQEPE